MPSNEYAEIADPDAMATNRPLPHATEIQFILAGNVDCAQVPPPSVEYATTLLEAPVIATQVPILPYTILFQVAVTGKGLGRVAQVAPSTDVPALLVEPGAIPINFPPPYAIALNPVNDKLVDVFHNIASVVQATVADAEFTATNTLLTPPNVTVAQVPAGKLPPATQSLPVSEYTDVPVVEIPTNRPLPNATDFQLPTGIPFNCA
jgi:hypothetical protein